MFGEYTARVAKMAAILLVVLAVFFAFKTITLIKQFNFIGSGTTATNTIAVNGEGEAFAVPDIAQITATIEKDAKTAKEAQTTVSNQEKALLAFLKGAGIADKDIKTTNFSSYPKYEWQEGTVACLAIGCPPSRPGKNVLIGYTVSETISIKVRDTDKAGDIIDGITKAGINQVSGPDYTVDDETAIQAEARDKAIADAKTKAEALAKSLGVRLVRIVNFNEGGNGGYPMPMYAKAEFASDSAGNAAPSLPKGENKYLSNVTITYEIR
jgi:uncharacterized protein YggE